MSNEALVQSLQEAIADLGEAGTISTIDWRSFHFLSTLRALLAHHTTALSSLLVELSPPDTVEFLSGLVEYYGEVFEGEEEREMAWIMQTLNEGLFGCYVRVLVDNPSITCKYYQLDSVIRDEKTMESVLVVLDKLMTDKQFEFNISDYVKYKQATSEQEPKQELNLKSPQIVSKRSPEPVTGLSDALIGSPLLSEVVLAEFKEVVDNGRPCSVPIITIQSSSASSSSTSSLYSSATSSSTVASQGLFSTLWKTAFGAFGSNTSLSTPPESPWAIMDHGLVAQHFACSDCSCQITCNTSQRCPSCTKYKCIEKCFRSHNPAMTVPQMVCLNWDFTKFVCCNACSQGPDKTVDISAILPFALQIDAKFATAWRLHQTALPVALEMCRPCLTAPDPTLLSPSTPTSTRLHDLVMMHTVGSDPLCDAVELHLKRCEECRGRAGVCMVCGEGPVLVPFDDDNEGRFCGECGSAWHVNCEGSQCPNCSL